MTFSEAFRGGERTLSVNDERVQVRIPPGVKSGSKLRLKGKGNVQPGTGRRGDLYLVIEVQSHPIWTLDGDQLRAELPVAFDELALGGMVKVMTPDGEADVTIPPGTAPGKSLRLRGKGWPGKSGRGDLLLTLDLQWPKQWSDEQRELLEQLQSSRDGDPPSTVDSERQPLRRDLRFQHLLSDLINGDHLSPPPFASLSCLKGHGARKPIASG